MFQRGLPDRREFLSRSVAGLAAVGTGFVFSADAFAERVNLIKEISAIDDSHVMNPAFQMVREGLAALDEVHDYSTLFIKTEMVGRAVLSSRMELKVREKPFSVYLKFVEPGPGREVIYVSGQNNNMMLAHDVGFAGLAGTLTLDPTGRMAMDGNRYPLTNIGMRNMLELLSETWVKEKSLPGVEAKSVPNLKIGDIRCRAVEVSHLPTQAAAKFQLSRLFLDDQTNLPIRVQAYGFPTKRDQAPPLVEDYLYSQLKLNQGFGDLDFSVKNPKYNF
ncbi:DUF1571 domain-containing protein [Planctomicrobium sp. SH668]|uniref:DUF1571 domain-containing protein n=1 Tax=Planctomicrobium sp. SH668 TaxID=3448126 RepID=UPI003F5B827D